MPYFSSSASYFPDSKQFKPKENAILRFLRLKLYQYEVTFSLYVMTPVEKWIFNSFVILSFLLIAVMLSRLVSSFTPNIDIRPPQIPQLLPKASNGLGSLQLVLNNTRV